MNIVLIGMRGSGKSTIGKFLSQKLNKKLVDTDIEIEKTISLNICEIIEKFGWNYFREREKEEIIKVTHNYDGIVISTGGGVVINQINVELLKKKGIMIFLNSPIEILYERLKDKEDRPSLTDKSTIEELNEIWEIRKDLYFESADIVYNKKDINISDTDAENIINLLETYDRDFYRR